MYNTKVNTKVKTQATQKVNMSEHKSEVIFTPKEIIEACERSVEKKVEPFLSDVFCIDENVRKTKNCQYVSIYCKVG